MGGGGDVWSAATHNQAHSVDFLKALLVVKDLFCLWVQRLQQQRGLLQAVVVKDVDDTAEVMRGHSRALTEQQYYKTNSCLSTCFFLLRSQLNTTHCYKRESYT